MMKFSEWMLKEDNNRTGAKVGLYPPAYTLSQYPNSYYSPIAADYGTYHDIEKKNPTKTNPKQKLSFTVWSANSNDKKKKSKETP